MELGKAVGPDNKVTAPADSFGPKDTIYLSVVSDGTSPAVALRARWTFGPKGILINESTEKIATLGPKATQFHIHKASGWPTGQYTVQLFVDDKPSGSKQFQVAGKSTGKKKKK